MAGARRQHERFMAECLRLARKGEGFVSPNPMVGAVLVKQGRIVARGYHKRFGGPHAEVDCFRSFKGDTVGSTLYVNLEPCCYHGKTPPCTDLVIRSGIKKVVVGMKDPNPLVSGKGIKSLRKAGIHVTEGILESKARELNRKFTKQITSGLPYIHLKIAQSLDGKIAAANGESRWISSASSRRLVHEWRKEYDAVLVGAGTVNADNPLLTVRMVKGRHPDVILLDGKLSVSPVARIFSKRGKRRVIVCVGKDAPRLKRRKCVQLSKRGAEVVSFRTVAGRIPLRHLLRELTRRNVGSILVEGGQEVFTSFLRSGMVDLMSVFVSPSFMGEGVPAIGSFPTSQLNTLTRRTKSIHCDWVDRDVLLQTQFD